MPIQTPGVPQPLATTDSPTFAGLVLGATSGTGGTSRRVVSKVASIADGVPSALFTVTVPNGSHSAVVRLFVAASLGAGGSVGAGESTRSASYSFAIARVTDLDVVSSSFSTPAGATIATVAGGATVSISPGVSANVGANTATQTFNITITITRGSGSSDNHACVAEATLLNLNNSGITIEKS